MRYSRDFERKEPRVEPEGRQVPGQSEKSTGPTVLRYEFTPLDHQVFTADLCLQHIHTSNQHNATRPICKLKPGSLVLSSNHVSCAGFCRSHTGNLVIQQVTGSARCLRTQPRCCANTWKHPLTFRLQAVMVLLVKCARLIGSSKRSMSHTNCFSQSCHK